ncbi:MAG TPA: metallophosphoesterase family protein [Clostridia bacterium]|nr:metallophosphoesterase family protein [Clostridia bacterium]
MKRTMKAMVSILLVFSITFLSSGVAFAGGGLQGDSELRFNSNGEFTILQFADCQDDALPRKAMIMLMERALDDVEPDLVVFTGDNCGVLSTKITSRIAIKALLKPVAQRGIAFTFVFGNHDAEKVSKEFQLSVYQGIDGCLAFDDDPSIYGCANHNLEIKSNDGSETVFNLWMIDSNMYDDVNGGYDWVHTDQIDWYKAKSQQLENENSGKVPSFVFQHICVPETYNLLLEAPEGTTQEVRNYNGKNYIMELNPEMAQGTLREWPCPSKTNAGEFDAFVERGDVLGIVTGHDHVNSFIGTYMGIDLIQTQGIGFQTYGDEQRGYRVITLKENNPWGYESYTKTFADVFGEGLEADFIYKVYGSEVGFLVYAIVEYVKNLISRLVF